ncbi:hypothetical protein BDP27DRAFT_608020 [Rhodocollybia butyracea]|uniref:Uncharacterized protein n=1 Tax=Rhodocollybia butyracea TaxID=206335 RepID=A0A9P5UFK3_9AGAR|nr:hypothetical protein BDP27DRAFT_608020 [Rhodocollybia butyracea]
MVSDNPDAKIKLFEPASGLCSLFLVRLGAIPGAFCKKISSLAVDSVDGDISNVLKHAPSPKELTLGERRYFHPLPPVSPCAPPRLCTDVSTLKLELRHNGSDLALADAVFSSFTFPSLSCLVITSDIAYPYQGAWPEANLEVFLRRSSCNLTKFEVKKCFSQRHRSHRRSQTHAITRESSRRRYAGF